ncbi:hypothetical protein F5Y00DRAFT_257974 [Daldinia vernicosa]|uniref:uncharacterized protein n=1 Tax=Daldinia vernicosa TaxID=114800 RepID=UPI002008ACE2|nr:uncharacterized protein F5Y00DRAFT_257974 [Daldinia vernicosa]KAI0852715.1 hypothetical protein F5Y00DRAFT_257974 [Daldinia vernicosa]
MSIVMETLVAKVDRLDKDGLDIEFTVNHQYNAYGISGRKLLSKFKGAMQEALSRKYQMQTDMTRVLTHIFDGYLRNTEREMTLIVLTDGNWAGTSDETSVERSIAEFLRKPALALKLEKRWFTIQFVALGPGIPDILARLDDNIGKEYSIPDIVDTEHVSGSVNKMILGSFVDRYDAVEASPGPSTPRNGRQRHHETGLYEAFEGVLGFQEYRHQMIW